MFAELVLAAQFLQGGTHEGPAGRRRKMRRPKECELVGLEGGDPRMYQDGVEDVEEVIRVARPDNGHFGRGPTLAAPAQKVWSPSWLERMEIDAAT